MEAWYDEQNGRLFCYGDEQNLPFPTNMGTRTVGVTGAMVRRAVEEKIADGLDATILLGNF